MSLVIDSSITLAWFFEDERTERADVVMHQVAKTGAVVPLLLAAGNRQRVAISIAT